MAASNRMITGKFKSLTNFSHPEDANSSVLDPTGYSFDDCGAEVIMAVTMSDITTVTQFLNTYYQTFSTLNLDSIAPFFHEPCLFLSPQGVMAVPNHDVVKEVFRTIAKDFRSKGYGRSELTQLNVERMSATAMLGSGVAVRFTTDGRELERVGVTYILQKSDNGWKIAVTVIHDA
jgi:ketosteroid isomerase-like protein